jgi:hypothetical protein
MTFLHIFFGTTILSYFLCRGSESTVVPVLLLDLFGSDFLHIVLYQGPTLESFGFGSGYALFTCIRTLIREDG